MFLFLFKLHPFQRESVSKKKKLGDYEIKLLITFTVYPIKIYYIAADAAIVQKKTRYIKFVSYVNVTSTAIMPKVTMNNREI